MLVSHQKQLVFERSESELVVYNKKYHKNVERHIWSACFDKCNIYFSDKLVMTWQPHTI